MYASPIRNSYAHRPRLQYDRVTDGPCGPSFFCRKLGETLIRFQTISILFLFCAAGLLAQAPKVISPEIHSDSTVTFRLVAPKADKVLLLSYLLKTEGPREMTKDADGVWSTTAGPLLAGNYIYGFEVDGQEIADPINPAAKLRAARVGSLLHIPGDALWAARDVPHGNVDINFHKSDALGDTRWMFVYTPASYEKYKNRRYPVLYLLHGNNDTAAGWTMVGSANFILDNLIASGEAEEMIVVMPNGHAAPYGDRGNTERFSEYLLNDVMPMIESKYRTSLGSHNRALAGLSMGGGRAVYIGFNNLEKFSALAMFSGAVPRDFETSYASQLADPSDLNKLDALWIGCGTDDFLHDRNLEFGKILTEHGVNHTLRMTEGVHNYEAWRRYLAEFAPLLFH